MKKAFDRAFLSYRATDARLAERLHQQLEGYACRDHPSPFGLIDTVGNAGDWVVNDVSSYDNVYMGATYHFNPEDATTFRLLPMTDEALTIREITTRCVDPAP